MADSNNNYYVDIDRSYDRIHRTTWARRTAGFLSGATIGATFGAAIGATAAFLPYLLGALAVTGAAPVALPALAVIASAAGFCAGFGALIGMAINADVAVNSASTTASLQEKETRDKLASGIALKPDAPKCANLKDDVAATFKGPMPRLFSWKVAAVTSTLFAAFGALIALNPTTASIATNNLFSAGTGLALDGTAKIVASAAVFGLFGSTIGIKMSMISNKVSNFYYKLLTDQYFNKAPQQQPAMVPCIARETEVVDAPEVSIRVTEVKPFAQSQKRFTLSSIISGEEPSANNDIRMR